MGKGISIYLTAMNKRGKGRAGVPGSFKGMSLAQKTSDHQPSSSHRGAEKSGGSLPFFGDIYSNHSRCLWIPSELSPFAYSLRSRH